jgi:hypothetical protein
MQRNKLGNLLTAVRDDIWRETAVKIGSCIHGCGGACIPLVEGINQGVLELGSQRQVCRRL